MTLHEVHLVLLLLSSLVLNIACSKSLEYILSFSLTSPNVSVRTSKHVLGEYRIITS
jgi:hypothetical protein